MAICSDVDVGKFYRFNEEPTKNSLTRELKRFMHGTHFEVKATVSRAGFGSKNILSVMRCSDGKVLTADQGDFSDYWALFTENDVESLLEEVDSEETKNFIVLTHNTSNSNKLYSRSMAKDEAETFAVSQKENSSKDVRVYILRIDSEVTINTSIVKR